MHLKGGCFCRELLLTITTSGLVCDDEQIVHSNFSFDQCDRETVVDSGEIIKKSSEEGTGN